MASANESSFVAYYRVSTDRQGESGLGLEAQRAAVVRFTHGASLLSEFQEIESGKRHTNRPQLAAALDQCRRHKATLVIARLDRLARNVHFISGLMESGVDFVAVDMPQANRLTIHILAAVAEHEREAISQRTKAALGAAKQRGTQLGNPRWEDSIEGARTARNPVSLSHALLMIMQNHHAEGWTFRRIAAEMNALGLKTPRGANWYASTVRASLRPVGRGNGAYEPGSSPVGSSSSSAFQR
jgi:DNA invertase Pin-like site-specific DNA recombinase